MRAVAVQSFVAALVLASACATGASQERLGDQAYGEGRYRDALAEYREAVKSDPGAGLWAKVGAAALRGGDAPAAAQAYLRLAGEDPTRADEAAEGLETAARAAVHAGDVRTLQAAVAGLEAIAPERTVGRYALVLARRPGTDPADLVALLPGAIAAAPDPNTADSLLAVYGAGLQETAGCDAAIPVFRAALRRSRNEQLRAHAGEGVAGCALALGRRAAQAGKRDLAGGWFMETMAVSAAPESLRAAAADALRALGVPDSAGDSTRTSTP